jgi:hypothetical protein
LAETREEYQKRTQEKIDALPPEERKRYDEAIMCVNAVCFDCPRIFLRHELDSRCEATFEGGRKCRYAYKTS